MLIFVLLSNLIKNSIFHNLELNGTISIELSNSYLLISNSSLLNKTKENLFERFITGQKSENSIGLGLSIVKRICDLYNIKIEYAQSNNEYHFKLEF